MSADAFRMLLAENPASAAVRAGLASALLQAGEPDAAIHEATLALMQDATLVQPWLVRGDARKRLRDFAGAAADLAQARVLAPGSAAVLVNLANAYAEGDRLGDAEACLRAAVAAEPGCVEAQLGLASVLLRLERLAEAEAPCRAALALAPDLPAAHRNLACILAARDPLAARAHRDAAYRREHIFITPGDNPARGVLVLIAADAANVPLRHLLDRRRNRVVEWAVEYATPADAAALAGCDVVFNAIGDPDLAPEFPPAARAILGARPVLNPPAAVARTARSELPALLDGIPGCVVPRAVRVAAGEGAKGLGFPLLQRPHGTHGGEGVRLVPTPAALAAAPGYLTEFVDFASADGLYRKYRAIFVGGAIFPYHLAIAPRWLVHYWTAGMDAHPERRAEEQAFLADPAAAIGPTAMAALAAIAARLGLDYGGIDFGVLPDGRLLVFEANATMLVHPEHDGPFTYRNPHVAAIQAEFARLIAAG